MIMYSIDCTVLLSLSKVHTKRLLFAFVSLFLIVQPRPGPDGVVPIVLRLLRLVSLKLCLRSGCAAFVVALMTQPPPRLTN